MALAAQAPAAVDASRRVHDLLVLVESADHAAALEAATELERIGPSVAPALVETLEDVPGLPAPVGGVRRPRPAEARSRAGRDDAAADGAGHLPAVVGRRRPPAAGRSLRRHRSGPRHLPDGGTAARRRPDGALPRRLRLRRADRAPRPRPSARDRGDPGNRGGDRGGAAAVARRRGLEGERPAPLPVLRSPRPGETAPNRRAAGAGDEAARRRDDRLRPGAGVAPRPVARRPAPRARAYRPGR